MKLSVIVSDAPSSLASELATKLLAGKAMIITDVKLSEDQFDTSDLDPFLVTILNHFEGKPLQFEDVQVPSWFKTYLSELSDAKALELRTCFHQRIPLNILLAQIMMRCGQENERGNEKIVV